MDDLEQIDRRLTVAVDGCQSAVDRTSPIGQPEVLENLGGRLHLDELMEGQPPEDSVFDQDPAERSLAFENEVTDLVRTVLEIESHDAVLHHEAIGTSSQQDLSCVVDTLSCAGEDGEVDRTAVVGLQCHCHVSLVCEERASRFRYLFGLDRSGRRRGFAEERKEPRGVFG